jgi:hypothetical protein
MRFCGISNAAAICGDAIWDAPYKQQLVGPTQLQFVMPSSVFFPHSERYLRFLQTAAKTASLAMFVCQSDARAVRIRTDVAAVGVRASRVQKGSGMERGRFCEG